MNYDREQLKSIGNNVASLWGGDLVDYEVDEKEKVVIYYCIEHGEIFSTKISFDELEEYL